MSIYLCILYVQKSRTWLVDVSWGEGNEEENNQATSRKSILLHTILEIIVSIFQRKVFYLSSCYHVLINWFPYKRYSHSNKENYWHLVFFSDILAQEDWQSRLTSAGQTSGSPPSAVACEKSRRLELWHRRSPIRMHVLVYILYYQCTICFPFIFSLHVLLLDLEGGKWLISRIFRTSDRHDRSV